jgi:hypothetical protein
VPESLYRLNVWAHFDAPVLERKKGGKTAHGVAPSKLRWNTKKQQYFLPKGATHAHYKPGQFLSPKAVRAIIESDIADKNAQIQELLQPLQSVAQSYLDGKTTRDEYGAALTTWRGEMAQLVKNLHINHLAAARGGYDNLDSAAYGRLGAIFKYHYGKLGQFADDMWKDPLIALGQSPGRMPASQRAALYGSTALFTFEAERVLSHAQSGYSKYRNVPHSNESCQGRKGCAAETAKGAQEIGKGIPIGHRLCGPADLCTWEFEL